MISFDKKWAPQRKQPLGEKIRESLVPPRPLRKKIDETQRALQSQISKLDAKTSKIKEKDSAIFNKVVTSIQKHDNEHASAYSSELAEVRKMMRTVTQTKMILEQISLRLSTVQDIGDLAVALSPAVSVIKGMRSSLTGILPEASSELGEIGGMLSSLIIEAGQLSGIPMSFEPGSEDAEKILAEAAAVAERKTSEKFPDLPVSTAKPIGLPTTDSNP